jgi:hypothetical protein
MGATVHDLFPGFRVVRSLMRWKRRIRELSLVCMLQCLSSTVARVKRSSCAVKLKRYVDGMGRGMIILP